MAGDISHLLRNWSFDSARVQARTLEASDGRTLLQLRVDMGLLQMEIDDRPDGERPGGFPSILDRYKALAERIQSRGGSADDFAIPPEDFPEVDREILQYYHRRLAFFSLGDHERAARDAEHGLELLRFIQRHAKDAEYVSRHDRMIPFVLMERTRARSLSALRRRRPEEALAHIEEGIGSIRAQLRESMAEADGQGAKYISFLHRWARRIRRAGNIELPLERQLENAVRREDYEEAARLRDEIRRRRATR